jgi:hypothetical protein
MTKGRTRRWNAATENDDCDEARDDDCGDNSKSITQTGQTRVAALLQ